MARLGLNYDTAYNCTRCETSLQDQPEYTALVVKLRGLAPTS